MLDDTLLHPPVVYSSVWTAVGVALVAVALLSPVVIRLATRRTPLRLPRPSRRSTRVRRACLARVDEVVRAHGAGRLDDAAAASELSRALRRFAAEWSGVPYPGMTLAELAESDADERFRRVVAELYDAAFVPGAGDRIGPLADQVREVVTRWNRS